MTAANRTARTQARVQWGLLAFVLLGLAVVVAVLLLVVRGSGGSEEPYSLRSAQPSGLLGLRLWLEDMGYEVQTGKAVETVSDPGLTLLFPGVDLSAVDRTLLRNRVEAGGTLVVANASGVGLSSTFGVLVQTQQTYSDVKLWAAQPVLPSSGRQYGRVSGRALSTSGPGFNTVPVIKTEHGDATVLLQTLGKGTVWHIGIDGALTNADLQQGWGRELVVAALRGAPAGSTVEIWNDEAQSAIEPRADVPSGPNGLREWMLRSPIGWAALLLTGLLLLYLFTQGRRLGPALVVADPHRRRAAVEHIEAMAALAQRAGHRDGVARYQKARLKRRLGQTWRVSAELDDRAFTAALSDQARLSNEQANELQELLARFDQVKDEGALIELVAEAGRFTV